MPPPNPAATPHCTFARNSGTGQALLPFCWTPADINVQDIKGTTALMVTVRQGRPESVKLLLERGADVEIQDKMSDRRT